MKTSETGNSQSTVLWKPTDYEDFSKNCLIKLAYLRL